jgi:hypothetical protein
MQPPKAILILILLLVLCGIVMSFFYFYKTSLRSNNPIKTEIKKEKIINPLTTQEKSQAGKEMMDILMKEYKAASSTANIKQIIKEQSVQAVKMQEIIDQQIKIDIKKGTTTKTVDEATKQQSLRAQEMIKLLENNK